MFSQLTAKFHVKKVIMQCVGGLSVHWCADGSFNASAQLHIQKGNLLSSDSHCMQGSMLLRCLWNCSTRFCLLESQHIQRHPLSPVITSSPVTLTFSTEHFPLFYHYLLKLSKHLNYRKVLASESIIKNVGYCIIPMKQHAPSAAQMSVVPFCDPLQQGQQEQHIIIHNYNGLLAILT